MWKKGKRKLIINQQISSGGSRGKPPYRPNFFQFHAVIFFLVKSYVGALPHQRVLRGVLHQQLMSYSKLESRAAGLHSTNDIVAQHRMSLWYISQSNIECCSACHTYPTYSLILQLIRSSTTLRIVVQKWGIAGQEREGGMLTLESRSDLVPELSYVVFNEMSMSYPMVSRLRH